MLSEEVCCLPGACIKDVTERVERLVKPKDTYPFLLIHEGTNDTAHCSVEHMKRDYVALGKRVKDLGAQVVFSSVLLVNGRGLGRERKTMQINDWLCHWCHRERFGFLDHGSRYRDEALLSEDGLHLSKMGKNVFAKGLVDRVRRALN